VVQRSHIIIKRADPRGQQNCRWGVTIRDGLQWIHDSAKKALQEAIARYGAPAIFNTDQGSQFTSNTFTQILQHYHISISMDGRSRWRDNVHIERLWRTVNYEDIYLQLALYSPWYKKFG